MMIALLTTLTTLLAIVLNVEAVVSAIVYDISAPPDTTSTEWTEDFATNVVKPLGTGSSEGLTMYEQKIIHTKQVIHRPTETVTNLAPDYGLLPYTEIRTIEQGASTMAFNQPPQILDVGPTDSQNKLANDGLKRDCSLNTDEMTGVCVEVGLGFGGTITLGRSTTVLPPFTPFTTRTYTGSLIPIATVSGGTTSNGSQRSVMTGWYGLLIATGVGLLLGGGGL